MGQSVRDSQYDLNDLFDIMTRGREPPAYPSISQGFGDRERETRLELATYSLEGYRSTK